jgi:hypothetical protein
MTRLARAGVSRARTPPEDLKRLMEFYAAGQRDGGFERGVQAGAATPAGQRQVHAADRA